MRAPYTIFGKTRMVPVRTFLNGVETFAQVWDEELWVERGEDEYGAPVDKVVRVIYREDWLRSPEV